LGSGLQIKVRVEVVGVEYRIGFWRRATATSKILKVSNKIFGPKRDEVLGVWRKLHNEEFRDL
jgi:hypothetical protein